MSQLFDNPVYFVSCLLAAFALIGWLASFMPSPDYDPNKESEYDSR